MSRTSLRLHIVHVLCINGSIRNALEAISFVRPNRITSATIVDGDVWNLQYCSEFAFSQVGL